MVFKKCIDFKTNVYWIPFKNMCIPIVLETGTSLGVKVVMVSRKLHALKGQLILGFRSKVHDSQPFLKQRKRGFQMFECFPKEILLLESYHFHGFAYSDCRGNVSNLRNRTFAKYFRGILFCCDPFCSTTTL